MHAIHVKCERESVGFRLMTKVGEGLFRTCCWDFSAEQADALVGGWIYLHPVTKKRPSEFGGKITSCEITDNTEGYPGRVAFVFEARPKGRGQAWRGQDHGMAWTGGLVPADLPHEQ